MRFSHACTCSQPEWDLLFYHVRTDPKARFGVSPVYECLGAAVTTCHKQGGLRQQKFARSQSGGQKSDMEASAGLAPRGALRGSRARLTPLPEAPAPLPVPGRAAASLCSLPPSSPSVLCVSLCQTSFSFVFERHRSIGLKSAS